MNKHLNNWLDKMDGLPENTSNNAINKELKNQGYTVKEKTVCECCHGCDYERSKYEKVNNLPCNNSRYINN